MDIINGERAVKRGQSDRREWIAGIIRNGIGFLTVCWSFLMLAVFPLYAPEKYQGLGDEKFSFFLKVSGILLVPGMALAVGYGVLVFCRRQHDGKEDQKIPYKISVTDMGVLLYLSANLISWLLSGFRETAWKGVGGWNMGLRTQLLMIAAYILISRFFPGDIFAGRSSGKPVLRSCAKAAVPGALVGAGLAFLLGILHRFDVDPLGMYTGIDSSYKIWFLSTLGQATWFSSFLCTVLPVGVCFFCFYGMKNPEREKSSTKTVGSLRFGWQRLASGIFCMLGFMTLVTQNSDSAFAALGAMFLCLFLICCCSLRWMKRFLETLILCAISFILVGIFQRIYADRVIPIGELSLLVSQGNISWILLLVSAAVYLLLTLSDRKKRHGKQTDDYGRHNVEMQWNRLGTKIQIGVITVFLAGLAALVSAIVWNTQNAAAGGSFMIGKGSYMIFDNSWGSNRGFTWKTTAKIFAEMPVLNQLFGAGPDCFYPYSYTMSRYAQTLHDFWKPDILTNAHNEFLNLLICIGGFGLVSFLFLLIAAGGRFFRAGKKNPYVFMGLLTICSYAAHNFFCYQQVCCTPFLFLILGIAENLCRSNPGKTAL